ncbi:MAG: hypothetical protein QM652_08150 [Legionella sp.]|uniref:hypothetical protein n=1 Tax=Legionella sp. TaxID=459 RepID=UPI0039E47C4C
MGLESHLIQPIQRGPRYLLLLNDALKNENTVDATTKEEFTQIKQLVIEFLDSVNAASPAPAEKPTKSYEFGDVTLALIEYVRALFPEQTAKIEITRKEAPASSSSEQPKIAPQKSGYQFGDLSRWAVKRMFPPQPSKPSKENELDPSSESNDFFLL